MCFVFCEILSITNKMEGGVLMLLALIPLFLYGICHSNAGIVEDYNQACQELATICTNVDTSFNLNNYYSTELSINEICISANKVCSFYKDPYDNHDSFSFYVPKTLKLKRQKRAPKRSSSGSRKSSSSGTRWGSSSSSSSSSSGSSWGSSESQSGRSWGTSSSKKQSSSSSTSDTKTSYGSNTASSGTSQTGTKPESQAPIGWNTGGTGNYPVHTQTGGQPPIGWNTGGTGNYPVHTQTGGQPPIGWNTGGTGHYPVHTQTGGQPPIGWNTGGTGNYPVHTQTGGQPPIGWNAGKTPNYPVHTQIGSQSATGWNTPKTGPILGTNMDYKQTYHGGSHFGSQGLAGSLPGVNLKPHKTKKQKAKELINTAVKGYIAHKAMKKNKFISPSHLHGFSPYGMGGMAGHMGMKSKHGGLGKQLLGAALKYQIAKYAHKHGKNMALSYFAYKLGRELSEDTIDKYLWRYYNRPSRRYSRYYRNNYRNLNETDKRNITVGSDCFRNCAENDTKVCLFDFEVHLYQTLSRACYGCPFNKTDCQRPECIVGAGKKRIVTTVNKQLPGPAIHVCEGDTVLIDVHNKMPSSSISLHWHGLSLSKSKYGPASPFMDGCPGVTQCPIPPEGDMIYSFVASNSGTHFWRGQMGFESSDGVYGPLVVHTSFNSDFHSDLYDLDLPEHVITISELLEKPAEELFIERYVNRNRPGMLKASLLIKGVGMHPELQEDKQLLSTLHVGPGKTYRLRFISAITIKCPIAISMEKHPLVIIASDGTNIQPTSTSTLVLNPGERWDALLKADQQHHGLYWIQVKGTNDCVVPNLKQFAVLRYSVATEATNRPSVIDREEIVKQIGSPTVDGQVSYPITNPSPISCESETSECLKKLRATRDLPPELRESKANHTLYLSFSSRRIHNENFYSVAFYSIDELPLEEIIETPQINNLTLKLPSTPLMSKSKVLNSSACSSEGVRRKQCIGEFCECIHIEEVPYGSSVDLVLISEGPRNNSRPYTIHLHGHKFHVLSQEHVKTRDAFLWREDVMQMDKRGELKRNLNFPIIKDTLLIPEGGYSIIRFIADNIGYWLLESEDIFETKLGMGMLLKVSNGPTMKAGKAPNDFPSC